MVTKLLKIVKDNEIKSWKIFLLLFVFNVLIVVLMDNFIYNRETYHTLLSSRFESYQIDNLYMISKQFSIYNYLLVPVVILIRAVTVTMLIQLFFLFTRINLKFKQLFRITLFGLIILSLGSLTKIMWLISIPRIKLNHKLMNTMPLSFSYLFDLEGDKIMQGVMNSINVFELIWIISIGLMIKHFFKVKYVKSLLISLSVWAMIFFFHLGIALYFTRVLHG